ncbi:MAG: 50S ribosomal protein L18 [Planctomycetes bacterium]|nr:50S ribosomal protein L18 [Planctomycetota bacterium]
MQRQIKKREMQMRRRRRIRGKLSGSAERPRLSVHRSHMQIYAQVIDDDRGVTLCASSTLAMKVPGAGMSGAKAVGEDIARRAAEKGIRKVAFDRAGYRYHGRVKALADAARAAGLEF